MELRIKIEIIIQILDGIFPYGKLESEIEVANNINIKIKETILRYITTDTSYCGTSNRYKLFLYLLLYRIKHMCLFIVKKMIVNGRYFSLIEVTVKILRMIPLSLGTNGQITGLKDEYSSCDYMCFPPPLLNNTEILLYKGPRTIASHQIYQD